MNYTKLADSIIDKVIMAMLLINNPEIDPETRQFNQEILFKEVGDSVYAKVYDMNAYDFGIEHTKGRGMDMRYLGLAKIASDSISTGSLALSSRVRNFLDQTIAQAQEDAQRVAIESGKHPIVIRKLNGETCKWCASLAGTYENPDSEVFRRHRDCDCTIETRGYKSRNGLLKNYVKK